MNSEQHQFLTLVGRAPARLNASETAWYLGFYPHEVPILIAKKILKPLGDPPPNGTKYFSACELERMRQDVEWMARASRAVVQYRRDKNDTQRKRRELLRLRRQGRKSP